MPSRAGSSERRTCTAQQPGERVRLRRTASLRMHRMLAAAPPRLHEGLASIRVRSTGCESTGAACVACQRR
jgi:hypothetical protein